MYFWLRSKLLLNLTRVQRLSKVLFTFDLSRPSLSHLWCESKVRQNQRQNNIGNSWWHTVSPICLVNSLKYPDVVSLRLELKVLFLMTRIVSNRWTREIIYNTINLDRKNKTKRVTNEKYYSLGFHCVVIQDGGWSNRRGRHGIHSRQTIFLLVELVLRIYMV